MKSALFGLSGCLLLSVVGCIVSFKAVYLPSVALSFRLGTFIRLGLFRAFVGQNKSVLFWFGVVCVRGLLLYIKFLLLTILLETTKSCSVVRFAVCPAGTGFLMTGTKWEKVALFCRISLILPYFFI